MEPYFRLAKRNRAANRRNTARCRKRATAPDALSDQALRLLIRSYLLELQPANDDESAAVESMVRAEWLTRCLRKIEKDLFEEKIRELRPAYPGAGSTALLALAFTALAEEGDGLEFIGRVQDELDRQYENALTRLMSLRRKSENFQTNRT